MDDLSGVVLRELTVLVNAVPDTSDHSRTTPLSQLIELVRLWTQNVESDDFLLQNNTEDSEKFESLRKNSARIPFHEMEALALTLLCGYSPKTRCGSVWKWK